MIIKFCFWYEIVICPCFFEAAGLKKDPGAMKHIYITTTTKIPVRGLEGHPGIPWATPPGDPMGTHPGIAWESPWDPKAPFSMNFNQNLYRIFFFHSFIQFRTISCNFR